MPQSDIVQLAAIGSLQGQLWANVVHMSARSSDAALTPAAVDTLLGMWKTAWEVILLPELAKDLFLKLLTATQLGTTYADPGPPARNRLSVIYQAAPLISAAQGSLNFDPLPQFNAIYGRIRCVNAGRRYKGSIHLPGLTEDGSTGQFLKPATQTALQTACTAVYESAYAATVGPTTWTFKVGVFSKKYCLLNTPPAKPWDYISDITSCQVSPRVGSETRRKTKQLP